MRDKHKVFVFIIATVICLAVVYLHLLSHKETQEIYSVETEKTVINIRKDYLRDIVNNLFVEINRIREAKKNNYIKNTEARLRRLEGELDTSDEEFINYYIERFTEDSNAEMWTALLWDKDNDKILYLSPKIEIKQIPEIIEDLQSSLVSYKKIEKNNIEGIFGVQKSYIDELVKEEVGELIRNREYSNDSYIWVNEIINYDGGKDYAIRKIHPNLTETEGMYLSTDMEDVKGNLPYLEELEGIKENGEIYLKYYFQKLNKEEISEKLTFAKLYKDFDWIVAMGVHLDDIDIYTEEINREIYSLSSESIIRLLRYILTVLLLGFILIFILENRRFKTSTKKLEKQINIDGLTKAYSRRFGEKILSTYYKDYITKGENPAIMLFDIDGFKYINDKYGHTVGDLVLVEIVKTMQGIIRSSDYIIRMGGDEFVCIFPGLKEENIQGLGNKILRDISSIEIGVEEEYINITISIGFTYFKDEDKEYLDTLNRVDEAMYISKHQGKNQFTIDL